MAPKVEKTERTLPHQKSQDEGTQGKAGVAKGEKEAQGKGSPVKLGDSVVLAKAETETEDAFAARKSMALANQNKSQAEKRKAGAMQLSPLFLSLILDKRVGLNPAFQKQIDRELFELGVTNEQVAFVNEHRERNASIFAGDQFPANLQSIMLPPGAQKPPQMDAAPMTGEINVDTRYYPYRYAFNPLVDEDAFGLEEGALIYRVPEDNTYTALSLKQQTQEWMGSHSLPVMILIDRIGGIGPKGKELRQPETDLHEGEELPKSASGLTSDDDEEESKKKKSDTK